jgi:hypothetical protein
VKTALSADFGQFRAEYDPDKESWQPRETAGYKANEALFKSIFNQLLLSYLNENCALPLGDPRLRRDKDGQVAGIKRSPTTGKLDYIVEILILQPLQATMADKGDEYIQIGRIGSLCP